MSKWRTQVIDRLLELKGEEYSESTIAEVLNDEFPENDYTSDAVGSKYRRIRDAIREESDSEVTVENVRLAKQNQRLQDRNRIERKSWRNIARYENFFEEYITTLVDSIEKYSFNVPIQTYESPEGAKKGIVHLSDLHFNELVDIPENRYDFTVASKRLQKFADQTKTFFKAQDITDIVVVSTGDLINSDRRMDELLSMATVRARAVFLGAKLLEHFILDLNTEFNVSFAGVTGNESRIQKELSFGSLAASDNYDYTVYNILKYVLMGKVDVFLDDPYELVLNINNHHVLLTHGISYPKNNLESKVNETIGRYAKKGIKIDLVLCGHFHSALIGELFARSSSLVGANGYSTNMLNYISKASQNLHIIDEDGSIDSIKVDLQNTSKYAGYDISHELHLYEPREAKDKETKIFKI